AYLAEHGDLRRATAETVAEHIADADALVVRTYTIVDEALLARAPRLKVVGRAGVALDNIDVAACRARGVEVVYTPEANTLAVVDYTIRMIVEMNRRFWPMTGPLSGEQFHKARKQTFGRFVSSLTLGIIGCGRIGGRVGAAAVGLGMKVLYNDIIDIKVDYPAEAVDKPALYAASDVVTLHVPLTDLTRHLINAETLAQFKDGAQLINCARGACVNYHDLAAAIRGGKISAAAIDCHAPEPPPADYPMFSLGEAGENVILTPHIAARVPQAIGNMCDVVYDVIAVLEGRTPKFPAEIDQ
ncbi:MAG: phosphoglycerate dehydrogenase, partial [Phycisphaerae bacterium]|nr:phosphoglycerate dehydrogenase [Phycisphaerae bacterium]